MKISFKVPIVVHPQFSENEIAMNFIQNSSKLNPLMDLTKSFSQIGFIVESADGLTMNFMKVLSRLQVLRRGASRSYTSHYFQYLSVQSDRETSLPCRDKPILMKYSTLKAISWQDHLCGHRN